MRRLFALLGLCAACTPSQIQVRSTPKDALKAAAARLEERGIALDPAAASPTRLRTRHYCYQAPDRAGGSWDRSFARPSPGPVPFTHDGPLSAQDATRGKCADIFRVEIQAAARGTGSELISQSEWWTLKPGPCTPMGDPLLGELRCEYRYRGAQAPADVDAFIYGMLSGL
jgi:hypothetical protein